MSDEVLDLLLRELNLRAAPWSGYGVPSI